MKMYFLKLKNYIKALFGMIETTKERLNSLQLQAKAGVDLLAKCLKDINQSNHEKSSDYSTLTTLNVYFNSVDDIEQKENQIRFSIGGEKILTVLRPNPFKNSIDFVTYIHVPDLSDVSYEKETLEQVKEISISYEADRGPVIKQVIFAYLDSIVNHFKGI